MALGCAIINVDNVDIGCRCLPVVYSGKTIVSIKDYKNKIAVEIQRVKQLTSKGPSFWTINTREAGVLYADNLLTILPGCGKATAAKFTERGITTISQLKLLHETNILFLVQVKGLAKVSKSKLLAADCVDECAPPIIDH